MLRHPAGHSDRPDRQRFVIRQWYKRDWTEYSTSAPRQEVFLSGLSFIQLYKRAWNSPNAHLQIWPFPRFHIYADIYIRDLYLSRFCPTQKQFFLRQNGSTLPVFTFYWGWLPVRLLDLKDHSFYKTTWICLKMKQKQLILSLSKKRLPNIYQLKIKHVREHFYEFKPALQSDRRANFARRSDCDFSNIYLECPEQVPPHPCGTSLCIHLSILRNTQNNPKLRSRQPLP